MFHDEFQAVGNAGKNKLNLLEKNPAGYVLSSCLAGLFIALGCMLMGIVGGYLTAGGAASTKLICGLVFSVGLCLVFMAGAELFTGNNFVMASASLNGDVPWGKTVKVWVVCYLGNLIGSIVAAVVFQMTGLASSGPVGEFLGNAATAKMTGDGVQLFAKAILCNICVCVATWCSIKCKTEGAKLVIAIGAVTAFVTCGFEHSIANMTFMTLGLMNGFGSFTGFLFNLIVVTLGNVIGGVVFVAVPYYMISRAKK